MVTVVLVNYRRPELTEETVASLRRCPEFVRLQVVVVDNASGDGSADRLRRTCPDCLLLETDANLGFAGGTNVGIRKALEQGASHVLLLNNDTELLPGCLTAMLSAADERTLVAPKILRAGDPSRIWYGGGHVSRSRGGFYHETDAARAEISREVDFASACCLLIPAAFFTQCGLMDEDYFLYYEDAALCLKARAAGFAIRYVSAAEIIHKVGATTGRESPLTTYYGTRNRLAVLRRFGFPRRAFAFIFLGALVKLITRPNRRQMLRGLADGWRGRLGRRDFPDARRTLAFNGIFVGRRASGLERFALETLRALDGRLPPGRAELLVPRGVDASALDFLTNIRLRRCGLLRGVLWEQVSLPLFCRRHRMTLVNLTNTVPLLSPGIACLHDVFYVTHAAELGRSLRGWLSCLWHRLHYRRIARRSPLVLTVSRYSAGQIERRLGIPASRIVVLGNGWEHMTRIAPDNRIFARLPSVRKGEYLFVLGNDLPYKNVAWAVDQIRRDPHLRLVVTGARRPSAGTSDDAVVYTGYVSDGEMRALMENCRALLHPSLDEGFGIPPLEALALGRPAIVARTASLPEVYGPSVRYLDLPLDSAPVDLSALLAQEVGPSQPVLRTHTWQAVAERLRTALADCRM